MRTSETRTPRTTVSKELLRLGYWNSGGLTLPKITELESQFKNPNSKTQNHNHIPIIYKPYSILAIGEVGPRGQERLKERKDWHVSSIPNTRCEGMAMLINREIKDKVIQIHKISNRVIAVSLRTVKGTLTICFTYGPVRRHGTTVYNNFVKDIQSLYKPSWRHKFIIIGDINAKIRRDHFPITGRYISI